MKNVIIIGGGIVGLSTAYYLNKEGFEVTVIDKGNISAGASFVNAGYITPSHIIPLASPGMIAKGIKMMFNSASPFYMKPRLDIDFLKWSWYFHKSSTEAKVEKAIGVIKDINLLSRELFTDIKNSGDLGNFQLERKGLLMLYKTEESYLHEKKVAYRVAQEGLEVTDLNKDELRDIEPHVNIDAEGAIHYECDAHTTPNEIMPKLLAYLKLSGVIIKTQEEVVDLKTSDNRIKEIITNKQSYTPDEVVLAAGSWSGDLAKRLHLKLSLQGGKGYSINVARETGISVPAILMESKMAVTPMSGFTRFAGTMEFSGNNNIIRKERVAAIVNGASSFYPDLTINEAEIKSVKTGLRPVSPDGLPYIGRSASIKNLTIGTGHAMMGWSLGPATGKLITELLSGNKTSMDISSFDIQRSFT
ncbi:MAG TPA: amino acid dehydrogenase [Maribacter sp.]|uniref:NAD(P)/FAD-dependent oxidoreductase n=1 Tax=unclassified Maribacter TaxID=2615042 RepID=UPI000EEE64D3|nr:MULTISPECIES: FAD-dependent oxidoreductase [unclassified Maribacter]HAF77746.1 amino acid dehydrogenase [Maribacter sp.]|tara:strand:+ start:44695 stop:45945 length:1251 start_codon:yes stop_codon:yes gene_type:complete